MLRVQVVQDGSKLFQESKKAKEEFLGFKITPGRKGITILMASYDAMVVPDIGYNGTIS